MRFFRAFLLAILFVAAFFYVTTHNGGLRRSLRLPSAPEWVARPSKVEITEAAEPPGLDAEERNNVEVYRKVLPSVVNITSTAVAFDFFYGPVPQQGQGSGFVFDHEGHILTNNHVISGARQVEVTTSDKKKYRAKVIGADPIRDLAVIQISAEKLTPVVLGDSKALIVGQKVYAIGNPFGLSGTMTRGIISAIRSVNGPEGSAIDEAIQTDAAINPGNSGGPLLNSRGEVIGINSLILTGGAEQSAGVGFAIPINAAKAVLNDLVTTGRVRRPVLGIQSLPIGPELAQELGLSANNGLLIQRVVPGGAADRAGMKGGTERAYLGNIPIMLGGDLIVSIDGQDINDTRDIARVMNNH
ncbi:MAG TPA: trypsin-like peptidase domain-containing protein, partial [Terriglobales bacterium]